METQQHLFVKQLCMLSLLVNVSVIYDSTIYVFR